MNQEISRPFFGDELDPTVCAALEDMLSQTPEDTHIAGVMQRLHRPPQSLVAADRAKSRQRRWRVGITVAASFMLCVLWSGAQSETWGRVAQDFQRAALQDPAASTQMAIDTEVPASPGLRFVLMLHVAGLMIGLTGMLATWACRMWSWLRATLRFPATPRPAVSRCLLAGLIAYGFGIAFGCIWSQAAWGGPWSWDPREAFALVTLGIGMVWYTSSKVNQVGDPIRQANSGAFVASLAFWMIALLYVLGGIYSAGLRSYGFPSTLPTIIACLAAVNLLLLFVSHLWTIWRPHGPATGVGK